MKMASDALTNKLVEVIGQLQAASPKAAQIALEATRADALSNFVGGLIALAICVALIVFWRTKFWAWTKAGFDSYDDVPAIISSIALWVVIAASGLIAVCILLDPWTYITFSHPELWIAHKIITGEH
jgi:hypothetical protein